MGFFADIIADSRYEPRQPRGSVSAAEAEVASPHLPEQSSQPKQSQPVFKPDATTAQTIAQDASTTKSVEKSQPSKVQQSQTSDVVGSAQSPAPISQPAPPISKATKGAAGTPQVQRKSMRVPPLSVEKPMQSAVTKRAEKIHSDLSTSSEIPAGEKSTVKAESVYQAPSAAEQMHTEQPFQSAAATTAQEKPTTPSAQENNEKVLSKAGMPTDGGLPSQAYSVDETTLSTPVTASVVEQAVQSQPPVPVTATTPPHTTSSAKMAPPQVRIGQVNVIVEAPAKPEKAPTSTPMSSDMASRNFLRSL